MAESHQLLLRCSRRGSSGTRRRWSDSVLKWTTDQHLLPWPKNHKVGSDQYTKNTTYEWTSTHTHSRGIQVRWRILCNIMQSFKPCPTFTYTRLDLNSQVLLLKTPLQEHWFIQMTLRRAYCEFGGNYFNTIPEENYIIHDSAEKSPPIRD